MKTKLTKKLERAIWGETHKMGTYQVRRKTPAFRHGDISRQRLLSLIRTFV